MNWRGPPHGLGHPGHTVGRGDQGDLRDVGRHRLAPRLRRGDTVLLDNLKAHKVPGGGHDLIATEATVTFVPPYSHDFNPISNPCGPWSERHQDLCPRTAGALRRVARAARHVVTAEPCRNVSAHIGYVDSSACWG
jgi:hypothetical protein